MSATDRIIEVLLESNKPLFLWQIQSAIVLRYKERYETTAISARIRDQVRSQLACSGLTVISEAPHGKRAHQYFIVQLW
jgi:hypothetical protein